MHMMTSDVGMHSPDGFGAGLQHSEEQKSEGVSFHNCSVEHVEVQGSKIVPSSEVKDARLKSNVNTTALGNVGKLENSDISRGTGAVSEHYSGDSLHYSNEELYFERIVSQSLPEKEYRLKADASAENSAADHASGQTLGEQTCVQDGLADGESKGKTQSHQTDSSFENTLCIQGSGESVAFFEGPVSPTHMKSRINPFNNLPAQVAETPGPADTRHGQHVMAEVYIKNTAEEVQNVKEPKCPLKQVDPANRILGRLQDSKSLDAISQVCDGGRASNGKLEGRRATISSALELEGTVSHEGNLTNFVANNLQMKIKLSSRQSLDYNSSRIQGVSRKTADIPPIDPGVLKDLDVMSQDVAQKVDYMLKSLNSIIQNMTALSVGYIQTYRDSVDSLGESVDMSIKGMYTLMARCEELDRSMQPIHVLAKQIREIKRTLEVFEAVCK
ncbi:BLOC-1-related complex subunit 6 isoform X2 [Protopterus annectens]|uniref:BLOC-1-related complex subunit 6 isoform X2 n=1 Tax=Protopterus annectens TaxID=7888 RepID=UPI001CFBD4B6|nr:BLOC-1-related complex subunit 6 isoform X2 [Protopterus annectens]